MRQQTRKVEESYVEIVEEMVYSVEFERRCKDCFSTLVTHGKIVGEFSGDVWMCSTGIRWVGIYFQYDRKLFGEHLGQELAISTRQFETMIRCFAMTLYEMYILQTIDDVMIRAIISFAERTGEETLSVTQDGMLAIQRFLYFVGLTDKDVEDLTAKVRVTKEKPSRARTLARMINYLSIADAVEELFKGEVLEEDLIRWFPVYFWAHVTFVLPLRATEMLVTPLNCIEEKEDGLWLTVRRTRLKKGLRIVANEVNEDYELFRYRIPKDGIEVLIQKYIELTKGQERKYLFAYPETNLNGCLSRVQFNELLGEFVDAFLRGNPKYDFALYATGLRNFEEVRAGDSRHIALSGLYFQNVSADICRQLADHVHIDTTARYFTNVSETIYASSVMAVINRSNRGQVTGGLTDELKVSRGGMGEICLSEKRRLDDKNIEDCIEQRCFESCIGCKYLHIDDGIVEETFLDSKGRLDKSVDEARKLIANLRDAKDQEELDIHLLVTQTLAAQHAKVCEKKAEGEKRKWDETRNMKKHSYYSL